MTRVAIFGGSFNPPHLGHLVIAEEARLRARLDRVVWMPARRSPHKPADDLADAAHRLAMVRLAIEDNDAFEVSSLEIERPGPSFTVDTLRAVGDAHPDWDLHLIVGGDSWAALDTWREPDAIRALTRFVVYPRPGAGTPVGDDAIVLDAPLLGVSSTELRERFARGESVRYLVPDSVRGYIAEHGLYR